MNHLVQLSHPYLKQFSVALADNDAPNAPRWPNPIICSICRVRSNRHPFAWRSTGKYLSCRPDCTRIVFTSSQQGSAAPLLASPGGRCHPRGHRPHRQQDDVGSLLHGKGQYANLVEYAALYIHHTVQPPLHAGNTRRVCCRPSATLSIVYSSEKVRNDQVVFSKREPMRKTRGKLGATCEGHQHGSMQNPAVCFTSLCALTVA